MAFQCTYAGVPFQLPTDEAMKLLERYDWLEDLRDIMPLSQVWPGARLLRLGPTMPLPYPKLRIGDYFYPVGASRWSIFRGLMTAASVKGLPASGTFVIQCDAGSPPTPVSTTLRLLPPIPIAGLGGPQLYLVDLVDERYFWHQFQNAGVITCTGTTNTWVKLVNVLASALGITISFTDSANFTLVNDGNYGAPDPDSPIYSNYESPAVLLDAAGANVGCVVVRNLDGTYQMQSIRAASDAVQANRKDARIRGGTPGTAGMPTLMGGDAYENAYSQGGFVGDAPNTFPAHVMVVFPKWIDGQGYWEPTTYRSAMMDSYGSAYTVTIDLSEFAGTSPLGTFPSFEGTKVLRTTFKAEYYTKSDPSPNNLTVLQNLAGLMAEDYWCSRAVWLSEIYPGILNWVPEGISDLLWCNNGYTKVLPPPFNAGMSEFQQGGPLSGWSSPGQDPATAVLITASVDLSGSIGSWVDVLSYTFANDGRYYIDADVWGSMSVQSVTPGQTAFVSARLWDVYSSAVINNAQREIVDTNLICHLAATAPISTYYDAVAGRTIKLQGMVGCSGGGTVTLFEAKIESDGSLEGSTVVRIVPA